MRIVLFLAAVLLFAACGGSGADVPTDAPTGTPAPDTSANLDAVVFCPQIGSGSTPTTPTPVRSCEPGTDPGPDFQPYFEPTQSPAPLPPGSTALTNYFQLHLTHEPGDHVISLALSVGGSQPVAVTVPPGATAYFYTHTADGWQRLQAVDITSDGNGPQAQGGFDSFPANLIVLAEQ